MTNLFMRLSGTGRRLVIHYDRACIRCLGEYIRTSEITPTIGSGSTPSEADSFNKSLHLKNKRRRNVGVSSGGREAGNDILFGIHPCLVALRQKRRNIYRAYLKHDLGDRKELTEILESLNKCDIPHTNREKWGLDKLSLNRPHQDPMHFGAILRISYFLGVDRIIATPRCSPLTPVVSKASSGAMEALDVYQLSRPVPYLEALSETGWQLVGTCCSDDELNSDRVIDCRNFELDKPTVLIVGNEGMGVKDDILQLCHVKLTIQPDDRCVIDSLSVSVATGILIHSMLGRER